MITHHDSETHAKFREEFKPSGLRVIWCVMLELLAVGIKVQWELIFNLLNL